MSNARVILHPTTIAAIDYEMAKYQEREERYLAELSKLHQTIGFMHEACRQAKERCMKQNSVQAGLLQAAIDKAKGTVGE